ncbi:MAG TPA: hypothetical protein VN778_00275, partial [Verrucomicrobiae bacterium]|nr:hypothetical protein [Verrucomicrobiae bacterium]
VIVILSVIGGLISNSSQSNNQPQTGASTSEVSKFTQLNSCLDNVDSWWNANATTNGMALDLLPNYQQQVNQCKTEYPVAASPAYQSQNEACINNVDQWWGKEATTVGLADMMLPVKTEMVTECSTRYPNS